MSQRGEGRGRLAFAHDACQHIEPVDSEVVKDQMFDTVERGVADPVVIPVYGEMDGLNFSDDSGGRGLADVAEVRRPPSVLVHGQLSVPLCGEISQALADFQI